MRLLYCLTCALCTPYQSLFMCLLHTPPGPVALVVSLNHQRWNLDPYQDSLSTAASAIAARRRPLNPVSINRKGMALIFERQRRIPYNPTHFAPTWVARFEKPNSGRSPLTASLGTRPGSPAHGPHARADGAVGTASTDDGDAVQATQAAGCS